ncbi:MAG: VWA domain-containing protein [Gemmatimonadota bacterium]|nr:VWA domain-containing protein [Gemmatimonadota bacterium]MDH3422533.1 VWA domain-containing protein [Gemmatimonadota bacterium]
MTLLRPELLLLGPAGALLLTFALTFQWRRLARLDRAYGHEAARRLVSRRLKGFPTTRMLCLVLASLALGTAAAGPHRIAPEPPEPAPPLDIALAIDVSASMSATDIEPSRIERARDVVERIAEELPAARIVLVLFADWPYTLVPPTDDPAVVRYFAQSLSADLVLDRDQGTSFSTAFSEARSALDARPRPGARRAILVLSDGGAHEDMASILAAAESASAEGVPLWTAGLGTTAGVPLTTELGPVLDRAGRTVVATLDEDLLREVAEAGGGDYQNVSDERGLRALLTGLGELDDEPGDGGGAPLDASFLLTLLAVPLLLWEGGLDAGRLQRSGPERETDA